MLWQVFDDHRRKNNVNARDKWSPSYRHQFKLISELLQYTPRQEWPNAAERINSREHRDLVRQWIDAVDQAFPASSSQAGADSRESRARATRNAKAINNEQRRSSRLVDAPSMSFSGYDEENLNDDEDDDDHGGADEDEDDDESDEDDGAGEDDEDENKDEAGNDSDGSVDPGRTYSKAFVESDPAHQYYHVGNGYYKRAGRSGVPHSKRTPNRRQSTQSQGIKHDTEGASLPDPDMTYHTGELWKYPGHQFHHKGNGYYKPGQGPKGKRGSITVGSDGQIITAKSNHSQEPEDDARNNHVSLGSPMDETDKSSDANENETVDKAYTLLHPEIQWVHRGNGRYKRKSSAFEAKSVTPAASSDRRSSRPDLHSKIKDDDDASLRSSVRGHKRQSRPSAAADAEDTVLYDKAYVLAHPHEEFHHRGQGRYARGPRPKAASSQDTDEADVEGLVDSAYTLAHPDETFHHRGQGKWARGLPPPGSSNKVAVRGPGAKDRVETGRQMEEEDEEGNRPPSLTALVRREEGPDRWPNLHWVYRGGGKWCRTSKEDLERRTRPVIVSKRLRTSIGRGRNEGAEAQLQREAQAAAVPVRRFGLGMRRAKLTRGLSDLSEGDSVRIVRVPPPPPPPRIPMPRPPLLPPEEDRITDDDLPSLYKDVWSSDDDDEVIDEATKILRARYTPLVGPEPFVKALTKFDPAVRSLDSLKQLAENAQWALKQLQDEYLEIDKLVAQNPMHGKKERKPVKGGRQAVDTTVFEDKKEAMLYDYNFDPRKVGYQNPDAQRIVRDAEGRELRRRRGRNNQPEVTSDPHVVNIFNEVEELTGKRVVKPVSRFDGLTTQPPRKKSRLAQAIAAEADEDGSGADASGSLPASRSGTPMGSPGAAMPTNAAALAVYAEEYKAPTRGRWKDHIPKRIRELRGESVGSSARSGSESKEGATASPKAGVASAGITASTTANTATASNSSGGGSSAPAATTTTAGANNSNSSSNSNARKGRPPGSKNLHKRKDAGIKKGPRKSKPHHSSGDTLQPPESSVTPRSGSAATSGENTPAPTATPTPTPEEDEEEEGGEEEEEEEDEEGDSYIDVVGRRRRRQSRRKADEEDEDVEMEEDDDEEDEDEADEEPPPSAGPSTRRHHRRVVDPMDIDISEYGGYVI